MESEQLSAQVHTTASSSVLSNDASASALALDTATEDGIMDPSTSASRNIRPLSTANGLVQYLTAAHWTGLMKRVVSVQNDEVHATALYTAAMLQCAVNEVTPDDVSMTGKRELESSGSTSPSRIIPLVYELCMWALPADLDDAHLNDQQHLGWNLSVASSDSISNAIIRKGAADETETESGVPLYSSSQLRDNLDSASALSLQSSAALHSSVISANHVDKDLNANIVGEAHLMPSQLSLVFCIAVDDSLRPHMYALLCLQRAGSTVFLPRTVVKAIPVPLSKAQSSSNRSNESVECSYMGEKSIVSWIENSLAYSLNWARSYLNTTAKLSSFGLYIPVACSSSATSDDATLIVDRRTVVLWSDAESLITIHFGEDSGSKSGDDALHISLLCPIPLPGVGTLGVSGPPKCTVGLPRMVTSEEVDRIKRRCISIGELSLTIAEKTVDRIESDGTAHIRKKQKRMYPSSYFLCCGHMSHLEAFTMASGLVPTELYSTLARELLQHAFSRYPFSPTQTSHSSAIPTLPQALSLLPLMTDDSDGENVLSALSNAYSSVRPLLEFILLVSSYASVSASSTSTSNGSSSSSSSSSRGVAGSKSLLRIISLDCVSRCEPFIVCALYCIGENDTANRGGIYNSTSNSSSHSDAAVSTSSESLIGFIEVEIVRSSSNKMEVPDTPHTPTHRTRSDSTVADDPIVKKMEKILLKASGLSEGFEDQMIEMEIFRECFQKKFQAMTGRNPFHAFVNKLVSSLSVKKV